MERTKKFTFIITYFKPSGKYYLDTKVEWECRLCGEHSGVPYMNDIVLKIRGLRDYGGQSALPGIQGSGWEGFILVDCNEGFPCLIQ